MDGSVARTCKKESYIGNFLDHFNDAFLMVVPLLIILYKYPKTNVVVKIILLISLILFTLFSAIIATQSPSTQIHLMRKSTLITMLNNNTTIFFVLYILVMYYFKDIMQSVKLQI